ncbi:FAD:protein FMN transferase [Pseudoalteromonas denitrificans]|uniref:FAD:protein FMN transferase n=1 Tax=Pseudoalteromonas denitrificans DSM 6059 TaxID=1123010 RepID=A0A1I1LNZ7_9GAMM|nr:FAD:protein FMN transferase [Pseudoalteromonas denitrificans]SFC74676.1 thiamine biosynthesis lipoprotein [Pseudoalteromonas denitrificans DSM 6059]
MTVNCQLMLIGEDQKVLIDAASAIELQTLALEKKYNFYAKNSWLNYHINNRGLSQVVLDTQSAAVFSCVRELSVATQGLFDITTGTLKRAAQSNKLQSLDLLFEKYQHAIGLDSWSINGPILTFKSPETQFDLGGVIKEYAVDQAMTLCRKLDINSGLINFGGDVISWGCKPDGSPFRVAIQNPLEPSKVCGSICLKNQAMATSGHYERQFKYGSQAYSHILTNKQINQKVISVSVISNSVLTSGIFSTALCIKPSLSNKVKSIIAPLFIDDQLKFHRDPSSLT